MLSENVKTWKNISQCIKRSDFYEKMNFELVAFQLYNSFDTFYATSRKALKQSFGVFFSLGQKIDICWRFFLFFWEKLYISWRPTTKLSTESTKMDSKDFRKRGTEMVEYICNYLETLDDRRVTPTVEPGYLRSLIPAEAPFKPEPWETIMEDVESKIMPGVTHWQHPRFHAYFPSGNSFPSILGDMLSDAIGCIGFSWVSKKTMNQNDSE